MFNMYILNLFLERTDSGETYVYTLIEKDGMLICLGRSLFAKTCVQVYSNM